MKDQINTYDALDIANFLVFLMADSYKDLSNMKLNKLLYYADGHYLKQFGKPLFNDKIVAWQHGPVVKEVYDAYKKYSGKPIKEYDIKRIDNLDDSVKSFLVDIARSYGRYTAATLRNMTHKPKSPWAMVNSGEEITIDSIKSYFAEKEKDLDQIELDFSDEDFVGHRDKDGILVLPEDWEDE